MPVTVLCPGCSKHYSVQEEFLGRNTTCKKCGRTFLLSGSSQPGAKTSHSAEMPERQSAPLQSVAETAPQAAGTDPHGPVKKLGRFEIRGDPLGAGAFGAVFRGFDPILGREVALKVPHAGSLQTARQKERFLREAKASAQMRHPNIVPVYEAGVDGDTYYIASAFIPGQTLKDAIADSRFDFQRSVKIVRDLAGALDYAHRLGIVHRDVKPANIMLDACGEPQLMDFGLARLDDASSTGSADAEAESAGKPPQLKRLAGRAGVEGADSKLTQDGSVLGTPAYMAPEQASAQHQLVGPASDQYSLGVVLYELLCGDTPFSGPPGLVLSLVINQEPPAPRSVNPAIPLDLEAICLKAMAKAREHRYVGCREFSEDLRRWQAGEPIHARQISPVERFLRWCRRNPVVAGLSATAGMLLLIVAAVSVLAYVKTSRALANVVEAQRERALAQVESLRRAEIGQVPFLIEGMAASRQEVGPRLKELAQQKDLPAKERLRVRLALVSEDPNQVDYLRDRLFEADPAELPVIRTALLAHGKRLAKEMWSIMHDPRSPKERRFRAACALAEFDPQGAGWAKAAPPTIEILVTENPLHVAAWMAALRPVAQRLLPPLREVFQDAKRPESERSVATGILADYAAGEPAVLAELIRSADPKQFATLMPKLQLHGPAAVAQLEAEVAKEVPSNLPDDDKEKLAKHKANAAAALLHMDRPQKVWPLLKQTPDPRARSYLIHRLAPLGVNPKSVIGHLEDEKEVSVRRALLLAMGEYDEKAFPASERQGLIPKLLKMYREDPDAGIHGAVEWLLRQWGQHKQLRQVDQELAGAKPQRDSSWYVSPQGHTMVIIRGPVEFVMGSPTTEADRDEDEVQHRRRIGRSFALADKVVTVEQWDAFLHGNPRILRFSDFERQKYIPTPERPMVGITWYEAAAYCNWLSKQEGMAEEQLCYEANASGQYAEGMKAGADFLSRTGYRLPTEAEWEYACRAGAVSSRYYGETRDLLAKYAWYQENSKEHSWAVGSLKPNDFGLFDMQGNVWQWCHDVIAEYRLPPNGGAVKDLGDTVAASDKISRVLRGGAFTNLPSLVRSAQRISYLPVNRYVVYGLRLARTYR